MSINAPPNSQGYKQGNARAPILQQPQSYPPQQPQNYGTYQPLGHTQNSTVMMEQPHNPAVTLVPQKPHNYAGLSVFTILCCCWLFGIIALIYALKVDSAYTSGDVLAATSASRSARSWNIAGIVFGCVVAGVVVINIVAIPIALVISKIPSRCINCNSTYWF